VSEFLFNFRTKFICFSIIISSALNNYAQSNDSIITAQTDSVISSLEKVVVTATKSARKLSDSPSGVVVITRKEIQESAAKNIDDVIQYASGVQVKRVAGMGEGIPSDIVLRAIPGALAATRTLILVDGIATNVAGTPFLIINEIPLDAIQRVEIVKGPFSSMYGANALGGIINIITIQGKGRPSFVFTGETSCPFNAIDNFTDDNDSMTASDTWKETWNETYWNTILQTAGAIKKFDYLLSAGARTIGNYYNSDSTLARTVTITQKDTVTYQRGDNHDYTDYRVFAKGGFSFNDTTKLTLHLRYFKSSLGFGLTSDGDSVERITEGSKFLAGTYLQFKPGPRISVNIGGYYRNVNGTYFDQYPVTFTDTIDTVATVLDVCSNDFALDGRCGISIAGFNLLTIGFDQLWNNIDYSPFKFRDSRISLPGSVQITKALSNTGVYIQNELDLFSKVHVIPAIRFDYHSTYGINLSPKIGISVNVSDKLTLRSSAGKAFRAPTATELYMPDMYFGRVYLKSNPELTPETVVSCDGGVQCELPAGLSLSSDIFYNDLDDLVVIGDLDIATMRVSHKNVSKAWSWGLENEISWRMYGWIGAKLNYSFTKSENETYRQPLDYIPEHKGNMQIDLSRRIFTGNIGISLDEGYVGERSCPDWSHPIIRTDDLSFIPHYVRLHSYWRTDCTFFWNFAGRYTLSITAQNLFNAHFEESSGTLSSGRLAALKVKAAF